MSTENEAITDLKKLWRFFMDDVLKVGPPGSYTRNDDFNIRNESTVNPATGSYMIGALDSSGNTFGSSGSER